MSLDRRPLVSIVSVFHNRVDFVAESVQSLLAQDYPNLEIILYDDGSTDGTAEALLTFSDPRLRVTTQPNAGFTVTLNRAIRSASGEIVALHGSGDIAAPQRISKQVAALLGSENVGVVGCITDRPDSLAGPMLKSDRDLSGNIHERSVKTGMPFTLGAAVFRRSLFDDVEGFREFFTLGQGRDFFLSLPDDLDFIVVPENLYLKRNPPDSVTSDARKIILQIYLIDFAVQCAEARDRGEVDPLDRFGPPAVFLRRRSAYVAQRLHSHGLRWLMAGDAAGGRRFLEAAAWERPGWRTATSLLLIQASLRPGLWRFVRPMLQRLQRPKNGA